MTVSGAWDAGVREGTMEGVRKRSVAFCEISRARKARRMVIWERRWALKVSAQKDGGRPITGWVWRESGGMRMKDARWSV